MGLLGAAIGGVIGGAVGATVWALIVYFTNYEVGIIAWGVGVLAGIGVRIGSGKETGIANGILAVCIAISSIAVGKYAAVHFLVADHEAEFANVVETAIASQHNDDAMWVLYVADQVIAERDEKGQKIEWPGGTRPADVGELEEESQYPVDVLKDARARWDHMSGEEREAYKLAAEAAMRQEIAQTLKVEGGAIRDSAFTASWGLLDILFVVLAVASAFKLATGMESAS